MKRFTLFGIIMLTISVSLFGCGQSHGGKGKMVQLIQTESSPNKSYMIGSGYDYDIEKNGKKTIYNYKDNGLLDSISYKSADKNLLYGTFKIKYEYDDEGLPVKVWIPFCEYGNKWYCLPAEIKNVTTDEEITEAVLSINHRFTRISQGTDVRSEYLRNCLFALQYYAEYVNSIIRFDFTDDFRIDNRNAEFLLRQRNDDWISEDRFDAKERLISAMTMDTDSNYVLGDTEYIYEQDKLIRIIHYDTRDEAGSTEEFTYEEGLKGENGQTAVRSKDTGDEQKSLIYYYSDDGVLLSSEDTGEYTCEKTYYNKEGKKELIEDYFSGNDSSVPFYTEEYIWRDGSTRKAVDISDYKMIDASCIEWEEWDRILMTPTEKEICGRDSKETLITDMIDCINNGFDFTGKKDCFSPIGFMAYVLYDDGELDCASTFEEALQITKAMCKGADYLKSAYPGFCSDWEASNDSELTDERLDEWLLRNSWSSDEFLPDEVWHCINNELFVEMREKYRDFIPFDNKYNADYFDSDSDENIYIYSIPVEKASGGSSINISFYRESSSGRYIVFFVNETVY